MQIPVRALQGVTMKRLHSYSSIYNLGHADVDQLFSSDVVVQEKVDGSQFSFGVIDGVLFARSKGQDILIDNPDKMFNKAIQTIKLLFDRGLLLEGETYRGEYLASPRHNVLRYDRTPKDFIILFDVDKGDQEYGSVEYTAQTATRLGLEMVPVFFSGNISNLAQIEAFLKNDSILGGCKVEGVVIKNYAMKSPRDGKILMGKLVRPEFKELNKLPEKPKNAVGDEVLNAIIATYKNEVRWNKAIQHLRDNGQLKNSMEDIGPLLKEISIDILKECEDEIRQTLWKWAWPKISKGFTAGFPDWYKKKLLDNQSFGGDTREGDRRDNSDIKDFAVSSAGLDQRSYNERRE